MSALVWTLDPGDAGGRWEAPEGGGGGQELTLLSLTLSAGNDLQLQADFANLLDGAGPSGSIHGAVTTALVSVDAAGAISSPDVAIAQVPDSTDALDLICFLYVTNADRTQAASLTKNGSVPAHTPSGGVDWSTASFAAIAGADITYTGSQLNTTAGGVFMATLTVTGGWD